MACPPVSCPEPFVTTAFECDPVDCTDHISISNRLNVIPAPNGGMIIVPGCEPLSSETSITLTRNIRCCAAFVNVHDALAAIPGSTLEFVLNGGLGVRRRYFVLPPRCITCPCSCYSDWYQVLKDLACRLAVEPPVVECASLDMGYCPSPDLKLLKPPEPSPYRPEGTLPYGSITQLFNR